MFLNGTDPGLRQIRTPTVDTFTAGVGFTAGSSTTVTLTADPGSENSLIVTFDGITQHRDTYSVSGTTVTFDAAISTGVSKIEATYTTTIPAATPGDGAVTEAKLGGAAVTQTKLGDEAVNEAKLQVSNAPTNGHFLSAQSGNTGGLTWAAVSAGFTMGTEIATTSGTTVDITGIPTGTKQIIVTLAGVSWSASNSSPTIVLGCSSGFETSGYSGAGGQTASATSSSRTDSFALADTNRVAAADTLHGAVVLTLEDAANYTWVCHGMVGLAGSNCVMFTTGSKSLSLELTQVRVTTVGGDTYDAGAINVQYIS